MFNINKTLIIVFSIILTAAVILAVLAFAGVFGTSNNGFDVSSRANLTIVRAAVQDAVTRPAGFPDPEENWVKLPESENLALGKTVSAGEVTEIYDASNVTDGDTTTYWESRGVPADITIDLAGKYTVQTVAVRLNPAPIWEPRSQNFAVLVSTDGINFTVVSPDARYDFNPDSGNIARIDFDPVEATHVRLVCSAKTSGRSSGAQAAEICIYG